MLSYLRDVLKATAQAAKDSESAAKAQAEAAKQAAEASKQQAAAAGRKIVLLRQTAQVVELRKWGWIAAVALVLGVAADAVYHDFEPFLRWRVKQKLCNYAAEPENTRFDTKMVGNKLDLKGNQVEVLEGPTGSGKSTLLRKLALEFAKKGRPVALVRMRSSRAEQHAEKQMRAPAAVPPELLMQEILHMTCDSIGYPARSSILVAALQRPGGISVGGIDIPGVLPSSVRLTDAISTLFAASEELYAERIAAGLEGEAKVILLFDEVQDLMKDERLRAVGGLWVFHHLAVKLVVGCVDDHYAAALVTGSSAEIESLLQGTVMKGTTRYNVNQLADPSEADILSALHERGYAAADAKKMLEVFGTRLRLLSKPLEGDKLGDVGHFVSQQREKAASQIRELLLGIPAEDRAAAVGILEALLAGSTRTRTSPVLVHQLPDSARAHSAFSSVFFIRSGGHLTFQNKLIGHAWATQVRSEYVRPSWWQWLRSLPFRRGVHPGEQLK